MSCSIDEKFDVIARMMDDFRWAKHDASVPEHHIYVVLKAISADLQARKGGQPSVAEVVLAGRIDAAVRAKRLGHINGGHMIGLAQDVLAHWPAIKQGLELLGRQP